MSYSKPKISHSPPERPENQIFPDKKSGIKEIICPKNYAPIWQKAFALADNVRFTRTPDQEMMRRRAALDPVYAKILAEAEAARNIHQRQEEAETAEVANAAAAQNGAAEQMQAEESAAAAADAADFTLPDSPESPPFNRGYARIEQMREQAEAAFESAPAAETETAAIAAAEAVAPADETDAAAPREDSNASETEKPQETDSPTAETAAAQIAELVAVRPVAAAETAEQNFAEAALNPAAAANNETQQAESQTANHLQAADDKNDGAAETMPLPHNSLPSFPWLMNAADSQPMSAARLGETKEAPMSEARLGGLKEAPMSAARLGEGIEPMSEGHMPQARLGAGIEPPMSEPRLDAEEAPPSLPTASPADISRLFKSIDCRRPQSAEAAAPAAADAQNAPARDAAPQNQPAARDLAANPRRAASADRQSRIAPLSASLSYSASGFFAPQIPVLNLRPQWSGGVPAAPFASALAAWPLPRGGQAENLDALCSQAVEKAGAREANRAARGGHISPAPQAKAANDEQAKGTAKTVSAPAADSASAARPAAAIAADSVAASAAPPAAPAVFFPAAALPSAKAQASPQADKEPRKNAKYSYQLPSLNLLQEPVYHEENNVSQEMLERSAGLLESVLEDFGVKGDIVQVRPGPVVTLYEFEPAPGVKSSRIIGLSDDIARSMSAVAARVAVIPGRNAIGIELPNKKREMVYLREILQSKAYKTSEYKLPLALGKNIGGEPIIVELAKMPHLLVAGTTGSGKSVAINTMILSLLYRMTPEQCRLIMVDPKMLELSIYDGIPHLLTPVVTDPKKAITALKWAVREMENRYRKMAKLGVRNLDGFNARVKEALQKQETIMCTVQAGFDKETGELLYAEEAMDLTPLPYIVIIVDEMADLMMVAGKEIEGAIQRLAQMARAAGIHLITATQRPSVDVITGTIKANFPTRISFQVTSKIDSRTILGEQGAETLLGQGDMLQMEGGGRLKRVHGPFVSDREVEKIVAHLKTQGTPEYLATVTESNEGDAAAGKGNAAEDESSAVAEIVAAAAGNEDMEDLYVQAVKIVMRDKKCSTSYIQRRLGVGYNKAASLVEKMEEEGLVGEANHVGKREILINN